MYAQKFNVNVIIRGESRACPLEWLDQFCMRNFTNSADFDDTLPIADGKVEASYRLTAERFAEGLADHLKPLGCALVLLSTFGDAAMFIDEFRKQRERFLPPEIARLGRNRVRDALLHDVQEGRKRFVPYQSLKLYGSAASRGAGIRRD